MKRLDLAARLHNRLPAFDVAWRSGAWIAVTCGMLIWLVGALALGGTASASDQITAGQSPTYLSGLAIEPAGQQQAPDSLPASDKWAAPVPSDSFDPFWSPDIAEACDLADLYAGSRFHGPLSPSASRLADYPAPVHRFESGGTHARGPPRPTGQA